MSSAVGIEMKAIPLSRGVNEETQKKRAVERWENEGGKSV
jgi:muramoyltetrapeptide carboxypeptidase LdcA involved in peptidoglycan recycling